MDLRTGPQRQRAQRDIRPAGLRSRPKGRTGCTAGGPKMNCHPAPCPACGQGFTRSRKGQRFCSRRCQKSSSHNAARGSRKSCDAPTRRGDLQRKYELLHELNQRYYTMPPDQRLGFVSELLDQARAGNIRLREIFTTPDFIAFHPLRRRGTRHGDVADDLARRRRLSFRRCRSYPPVTVIADRLCRRLCGGRVYDWVSGRLPDPETGEVI